MLKIMTLVGARPQFIKSAAISRQIRSSYSDKLEEVIVHSGQHYDENMSSVFFEELCLPVPNYHFKLFEKSHALQMAEMLKNFEKVVFDEKPGAILVYGDTNTTLAGALVASKNLIPLIHVEAGLRSFNKSMPEEINRILTDHCSSLLFCPSTTAVDNLKSEGIVCRNGNCSMDTPSVYLCGDVMYDNSLYFSEKSNRAILNKLCLDDFVLLTLHRPSNTDSPERLRRICEVLRLISDKIQKSIVFPIHPRTKKALKRHLNPEEWEVFSNHKFIKIIDPVSYIDMIALEKNCDLVITDSGGVQKEAYFFEKPCMIMRSETEWVEIINQGAAFLVDLNFEDIMEKYYLLESKKIIFPKLFGDGNSADFICDKIVKELL